MRSCLVLLLFPLCLVAEEPQAVLRRAIVAHGGYERLSQARADRLQMRGHIFLGNNGIGFTNDIVVQMPGQYKSVVRMQDGPQVRTIVHILNGPQALLTIDDKPQTLPGAQLAQMRQTLELESAMRLVPLLADPAVVLTTLGEFTIDACVVIGIRVQGRGQRDLKLYFDKQTALLMAAEHQLDAPAGKTLVQQVRFSGHRDVGGHVRAGHSVVFRDGKKIMEADLIDARRVENIDPREFRIP